MASASLIGYKYARQPLSNPGQLSIAKSTLTGGIYIPGRDKRLVFASEWIFKPEGIRAVKIRFQDALKKNALIADHEWDGQDMVFRVRCIVGDTPKVSAIFSSILSEIINEVHGDDYLSDEDDDVEIMVSNADGEDVPFESDEIERISVWKKRHGILELTLELQSTTASDLGSQESYLAESSEKSGSLQQEFVWVCEGDHLNLDDIASDDILNILEDLTGCDFTKDLKQGKLFISHSSAENCQRAIRKLDNLKTYSKPRSPYVNHIVYAEGIRNFQLRFCPFIEIKKNFFKTTLLDPYTIGQAMNYNKLTRALTIRCASWNELNSVYTPVPIKKIVPAFKHPDVALKSKELFDFEYCGKGSSDSHPLRHLVEDEEGQGSGNEPPPKKLPRVDSSNLEQTKHVRIEGWAQQIAGELLGDDFGNVTRQLVAPRSNIVRFESGSDNEPNKTWDPEPRHDPFKSIAAPRTEPKSHLLQSLLDDDTPEGSFASLLPLRLSSAPLPSDSSVPSTSSRGVSAAHPATTTLVSQPKLELPARTMEASSEPRKKNDTATVPTDVQLYGKDKKSGQSSKALKLSNIPPPPRVRRSKGDAPQLVQDPAPEFATQLRTSFRGLMTGLQGFPGEVIVQVEFGKIILKKINPKFIVSDESAESFPRKEILSQLLPNPEAAGNTGRAFFTSILTTLPTDLNYILSMNDGADIPLWDQDATESSVIYEISCHNEALAGWNPFSIEIDGDMFVTRIKTRYDFGAISVHGIKRHWDFRMVAFGFGDDEQNETLYGDFARAIQCSLYIPPKPSTPCLYFELDNSFEKAGLCIDSILVRRVAKHNSADSDANSILGISEVRALDVDSRCPFQGATFQIYKAEPPPEHLQELGDLSIWHEASISSVKANEQLKQNTTLELGDEARWTPETLEELGAVNAMCRPACEMLKQMDGVGYHNDNAIDVQETSASESSPSKPYIFW